MRTKNKTNSKTLVWVCGAVVTIILLTGAIFYFSEPVDQPKRFLEAVIANDTQYVRENTNWSAVKENAKRFAIRELSPQQSDQPSVAESILHSVIGKSIDAIATAGLEWAANEQTLTLYAQGLISHVSAGQALVVKGEQINNDVFALTLTGGAPNKKLWLYFQRENVVYWKFIALTMVEL